MISSIKLKILLDTGLEPFQILTKLWTENPSDVCSYDSVYNTLLNKKGLRTVALLNETEEQARIGTTCHYWPVFLVQDFLSHTFYLSLRRLSCTIQKKRIFGRLFLKIKKHCNPNWDLVVFFTVKEFVQLNALSAIFKWLLRYDYGIWLLQLKSN